MITTPTTTSRREGLIDIVDYYWGLSDERKLSAEQCDQLKDAMNELRGSGDIEQCVSDLQEGRKLSEREERFRHRLYELAQEYIEAYDEYSPVSEEDDDEEV